MSGTAITKTYAEPPISEREILRYAGCREADDGVLSLMRSCVSEAREKLTYKLVYRELPICDITQDSRINFGTFDIISVDLAKNLRGCESVFLFAATVGIEIDRLIYKYGRISPAKALMMQAIGAERIEALCDAFCNEIENDLPDGCRLKPRFSPGYGDLPIDSQKEIITILDASKLIGLSLNESFLMSPSKSVTAFVGVSKKFTNTTESKCETCTKYDCTFRSNT